MSSHESSGSPPDRPSRAKVVRVSAHDTLARLQTTGLADFFSHIPATVWMTDDRMVVTFVQGAMIRALQVDPAILVGRTLPDLLMDGRDDHPIIQGHVAALAGHETSVRIEWGGNLYYARIAPIHDADGHIVGCVGIQQQIGWLPDDDNMLRESDIRLRRVIDENIIGIAFGDDEGRITDANDAFLALAGYSRDDLVAETVSWPALTAVENHQRHLSALQEIMATGRCVPFENEIIRKDGRRVAVMVAAARLSARRREGVAFVLDISERKRLERRLRAELACADALADASGLDEIGQTLVTRLCSDLEWNEAALWQLDADGHLQLVAWHGTAGGGEVGLESMAERALASGEAVQSRAGLPYALAMPLVVGQRRYGVLALVSRAPDGPDAENAGSSLSIGARIAKFLSRSR